MPAYPGVTFTDLNNWTAKCAKADYGVELPCTVANKEGHRPAGRARVLIRPSVAEVSPDVLMSEARMGAQFGIIDELEIRVDDVLQCA